MTPLESFAGELTALCNKHGLYLLPVDNVITSKLTVAQPDGRMGFSDRGEIYWDEEKRKFIVTCENDK